MADALVIVFGNVPRSALDKHHRTGARVITSDGLALSPALPDTALSLLHQLNTLCDAQGDRYSTAVQYHGYQPWWFHQQLAFDAFLLPFTRYRPLLAQCAAAEHVVIYNCPPELRDLVALMPYAGSIRLVEASARTPLRTLVRRTASTKFRIMMSVAAAVRALLSRADFLVCTVDQADERGRNRWIGGLQSALDAQHLSYTELLWSDGLANAFRNWRLRKRTAIYQRMSSVRPLVRADRHASAHEPPAADDPGMHFLHALATRVLMPRARRSITLIRRMDRLLRWLRPQGVFCMDDTLHAFELVVACKRRGIPVVGVQHGQFSRYSVGLMAYGFGDGPSHAFDVYCVWSEYFKELLVRHGALLQADTVTACGSPRAPSSSPRHTPTARVTDHVLFVIEHYEPHIQAGEVNAYLSALAASGLNVRVKPHPAVAYLPDGIHVAQVTGSMHDALDDAAVVVASHSSAVFDAIRRDRPVVLFATSECDDTHGLAAAGLATRAATPRAIIDAVTDAMRLPLSELQRRREQVWGDTMRDGGEGCVRAMNRLLRTTH